MHKYIEDEIFAREHDGFWKQIYRIAFPDFCFWETETDVERQQVGIDRYIVLWGDTTLTFDEKLRKPHVREYPDILLEYLSNDQFNTLGWMDKDLECDFIAYAWLSTGKCWFLSFPVLKRTWNSMREIWLDRFEHKFADNIDERPGCPDYRTRCVAVPIKEIQRYLNGKEMFMVAIDNYVKPSKKTP